MKTTAKNTATNSSHPLSGFLRQNENLFHRKYFSTFDKIAVKNPKHRVSAKRYR